jgi:hypothetical protein
MRNPPRLDRRGRSADESDSRESFSVGILALSLNALYDVGIFSSFMVGVADD